MPTDVISQSSHSPSSSLNPDAPMFVPAAYRNVDDFSDQWWSLVHSSPSFRDYWLRECFSDSQIDVNCPDSYDPLLPDEDSLLVDGRIHEHRGVEKEVRRDLIPLGSLNWRKARAAVESPRYYEKVPKIVNVKVSPRPIQQPR